MSDNTRALPLDALIALPTGDASDELDASPSAPTMDAHEIASSPSPTPVAAAAQVLADRYEVLDVLGAGGMGVVYRVRDRQLEEIVALKIVRGDWSAPETTTRFRQEVKLARRVTHRNVARTFDVGEHGTERFLTLEYVDGESLTRLLARERRLPAARALEIMHDVAQGLAAAHAVGVVHRDLKPDNVLVERTGRVVLTDFGIARGVDAQALTQGAIGTPAYMAPEQVQADVPLDARVDVYALGAVLYELLTGQPAWTGPTVYAVALARLASPPPDPRVVVPGLPDDVAALVLQLMARSRDERPADASAVVPRVAACLALARGAASSSSSPSSSSASPSLAAGGNLLPAAALPSSMHASSSSSMPTSVAVLPLLDLSPGAALTYLCDGVAEEVLTALRNVDGLRLVARSLSFRFRGQDVDAREVGIKLGVDVVLEGAVRRAGDRLRVTVQLVDVQRGEQRWSQRFDGAFDDVFAIQDEIAAGVTTALRGAISSVTRDAMRRPTTTPAAYEHHLRGRQLASLDTAVAAVAAEEEFRAALAIDPLYVPALAALAQVAANRAEFFGGGDVARALADEASARAVELAPDLVDSRVARGAVHAMRGDYVRADREFREARRLQPQSYDAHWLGARTAQMLGDDDEAIRLFLAGAQLRPEDFQCLSLVQTLLGKRGRVAEIEAVAREAVARIERVLAVEPTQARALIFGAMNLDRLQQRERATQWCERVLAAWPDDPMVIINAACFRALRGDRDEALTLLERCADRGFGKRDWIEHDDDYASLRSDPRFHALLARMT